MGQTSFFPSNLVISFYRLLLIIAMLSTVRYWKLPSFPLASLYIVFTFYAIVLFTTNYRTEMRFEFQHVAVQGRYIFPVIGVAYTLLTKSILDISPSLARKLLVALVLILFLSTYLGMFLANYSSFFVNGWTNLLQKGSSHSTLKYFAFSILRTVTIYGIQKMRAGCKCENDEHSVLCFDTYHLNNR